MSSDKTTRPLESSVTLHGWTITLTPDGRGIIIEPPVGQRIDIPGLRGDEVGKRLEVRVK